MPSTLRAVADQLETIVANADQEDVEKLSDLLEDLRERDPHVLGRLQRVPALFDLYLAMVRGLEGARRYPR